ncbi:MAG TPA: HK97-gp10 family putative phage morphogenesis protein [Beijerinckiaceae bacterium]|jgi:HK97 gp10 family phage protein
MIDLNLTGLSALQTLTRSSRVEEAAQKALERQAEKLVEAIRGAAPEDTGALRDSVRQEPGDDPLTVRVVAGDDENTVKPSPSGYAWDVAALVEFGTSQSSAQPFFWPTVNEMRGSIKADIAADIQLNLEKQ